MKTAAKTTSAIDKAKLGQVVLVFQGGGALGAYQAGVYQALQEAGVEPDWVIGTSIGAINAALIAGNAPDARLERMREFWACMTHNRAVQFAGLLPGMGALAANAMTVMSGLDAFFRPNPWAFLGMQVPLGSELAGRQCPERRDALFRQPRGPADRAPRDGLGRPAPRLPGRAH
jgi:NTE family protein